MPTPNATPIYVLITCARDEAATITRTLDSVTGQTHRPARWIIVDDSSRDDTGRIVEHYAEKYPFIQAVRVEQNEPRNFSGKIHAFRRGLEELASFTYDFIGNLDADIGLTTNSYYEQLLHEFSKDPHLGLTGGTVHTLVAGEFVNADYTDTSVAGAVQLFRRRCFEEVGGYPALRGGGEDAAAEIKARMLGWTVRKVPTLEVREYRRTGSANATPLVACYRDGQRFRTIGYDPVFYAARCLYRIGDHPYVLGSLAAMIGYTVASARRMPLLLEPNVVAFLRAEQRARLTQLFVGKSHSLDRERG